MTNGLDIARQPSTTVKSDQNQALPLQYYGAVRYRYRAAAICHSKNPIKKSTDATVSLCRTVQCYCNSSLLFTDSVLRLPVWLPGWLVLSAWTVHYPMCPVPPPHRRIFFAASASPSFAAACQRLTDRYLLTNGFRAQARKGKGESSDQRW